MFHTIELTLDPTEPTVLQRLIVLCRARGCSIVGLDYRPASATLTVDASPGRVALLGDRLRSLVGVLDASGPALAADPDGHGEVPAASPGNGLASRLGPARPVDPLTPAAVAARSSGRLATRC